MAGCQRQLKTDPPGVSITLPVTAGVHEEHRVDAAGTYEDALLQTGDVESAANWLMERLKDRELRTAALLGVQGYAVPVRTSRQAELSKRRRDLIARPDVQAEIAKVGRIESYQIEGQ
jgi:hypothetical protein